MPSVTQVLQRHSRGQRARWLPLSGGQRSGRDRLKAKLYKHGSLRAQQQEWEICHGRQAQSIIKGAAQQTLQWASETNKQEQVLIVETMYHGGSMPSRGTSGALRLKQFVHKESSVVACFWHH